MRRVSLHPGGGALTWKGGTGMCGPHNPLFTHLLLFASPPVRGNSIHKTPISKKNVTFFLQNQTFSEKTVTFSSRSQNFAAIFVKKLENFAKYSFSSPFFYWISAHKTPLSQQSNRSQAPKFGNLGAAHTYKSWVPPLPGLPRNPSQNKSAIHSKSTVCGFLKNSRYCH